MCHKSGEKFAAIAFSPYLCEVNLWCHDDSVILSTAPPYILPLNMSNLIIEIPPLGESDSYYLQERHKPSFNYPLHKHDCYELNFVENCRGARRIVGDSIEVLGDYDLTLVGCNLEHVWEQHECTAQEIHEITIQMPKNFFPESTLNRRIMLPIKEMLKDSKLGIAFEMKSIMKVYDRLLEISKSEPTFHTMSVMNEIFYDLASGDYHTLSSSHYSHAELPVTSRRIQIVKDYIDAHYTQEVRMETLSELINMTPNALSRFFKQHTNRSVSDYINDVRMGHAALLLLNSTMTVVEIGYKCGFNTISNFNRTFKSRKGCTPTEFRASYRKNTMVL